MSATIKIEITNLPDFKKSLTISTTIYKDEEEIKMSSPILETESMTKKESMRVVSEVSLVDEIKSTEEKQDSKKQRKSLDKTSSSGGSNLTGNMMSLEF